MLFHFVCIYRESEQHNKTAYADIGINDIAEKARGNTTEDVGTEHSAEGNAAYAVEIAVENGGGNESVVQPPQTGGILCRGIALIGQPLYENYQEDFTSHTVRMDCRCHNQPCQETTATA